MTIVHVLRLYLPCAICYISGRLNRIDQNKYLFVITTIAMLVLDALSVSFSISARNILILTRFFWDFVIMITLMIAYLGCYEEHIAVGLQKENNIN